MADDRRPEEIGRADGAPRATLSHRPRAEPSLGDLFKELARESSSLIRQETALAKAELRENFRSLAKDLAKLAVGGALLLLAFIILNAFLIVLIGDALDNYWLAALALGILYLLVGVGLVISGKNGLERDDLKPDMTLQTLRDDKAWVQEEVREIKRELSDQDFGNRPDGHPDTLRG
ncbi:MAG TPA: phage holin family protein [Longimicrobiaceae bacterium]|nr:phage holin family protein [Longimicrobiaceae bacterium]